MLANRDPKSGGCRRAWRVHGCRYCPTWAEVAQLWRGAAERRRRGGFEALAPSLDPEWRMLGVTTASVPTDARSEAAGSEAAGMRRPSIDELAVAWLQPPSPEHAVACEGASDGSDACVAARWASMLCERESGGEVGPGDERG